MKNKKIIIFISLICLIFFVAIGLDLTPYLRGPAPYPPDWQWSYLFINTFQKIWAPLITVIFIFLLFLYLNSKKEEYIQKKEKIILFIIIFLSFLFQLSVLFFSRAGIFVLIHRIINPDLNGYFTESLNISDMFNFLSTYNEKVLKFPMHAQGHPPGAILFFYAINQITVPLSFLYSFIEKFSPSHSDTKLFWQALSSSQKLASVISSFLIPLLSSFIVLPLYYLGKKLYGLKTGVNSIFLYIFIPSVVLFIPINDVFLAFFPLSSLLLFIKGIESKSKVYLFFSGVIFLFGIFFSLSLFPILIILFFMFLYYSLLQEKSIFKNSILSINFLLGIVIIPILLFIFFHFNFIEVSKTLMSGLPKGRLYNVWAFYNLYDFFIFTGIPVLILFALKLKELISIKKLRETDFLFLGFVVMIFLLNFSGSVRGEVGRIWLPFVPFLVLSITNFITNSLKFKTNFFLIILLLQVLQILIMQEFWVMLW